MRASLRCANGFARKRGEYRCHLCAAYFRGSIRRKDEVYHIDLIDSGNAFVFRDGFVTPAKWERTDVNHPLLLTNLDGSPIYFASRPHLLRGDGFTSTYTQDGNDWHFKFETP
ncbi:MAG: DUF3048 C-terminal domain-containing protein [Anaerolineales bacterium]|nr:DUF3048 C-terminal domain-containing protein [Anaerolineales bacterium]